MLVTCPPEPVRTTFNAPAVLAGVTTVTEVALTLVIEVPAVAPNVTDVVPSKLVPVIVTVVPPAVGPEANPAADNTDEIVGVPTNVKAEVDATAPPEPVRVTVTVPAELAGVTTVTEVALTFEIEVPALLPNETAEVPSKFVPVIVTDVPPLVEPDDGATVVIVGA